MTHDDKVSLNRLGTRSAIPHVDNDLGYQYTVALCSAIESATASPERRKPDAYAYRGRTLRYALERQLYVELVNNERLYELFRESSVGRPRSRVELRSHIDRRVARLTCGGRSAGRVKRSGPRLSQRAIGKLRATLRASAASLRRGDAAGTVSTVTRAPALPGHEKPVCVLLHQPKFLRFVRPVLGLLPQDGVAVLSRDSELREQVEDLGLLFVSLESRAGPDRTDVAGAGLREHPYLTWQFDCLAAELTRLGARCVVVVEGNHPLDELANQACRLLDIPCVCLQQGWSPIVHNGFRNMSFSSMFVWGEGFAELLASHNPEQTFVVTGSPVLDAADTASDRLAATLSGRKAITFFLQPLSPLIAPDHLEELSALIRETARRFLDVQVLVRDHPGIGRHLEGLEDAGNILLVPPTAYGLAEVLASSTAAISIYSTTLLEAAAMLVPPVAYNMTSLPRYWPDLEAAGAGTEVREREAALSVIERLVTDDAYRDGFLPGMTAVRERFFAGADGGATERIAARIADLARLRTIDKAST